MISLVTEEEETNAIKEKNERKKYTEIITHKTKRTRTKKHHEEVWKLLFGLRNQVSLSEKVNRHRKEVIRTSANEESTRCIEAHNRCDSCICAVLMRII
ncbi:hypothetical protein CAJAP_09735 [Camponotus japonicus]